VTPPPTPFDLILAIVQHANTEYARALLGDMRELMETGAAIEPWSGAVQLARDVGAVGDDHAYYLLDILTESVVGLATETDEILLDFRDQMDAVERRNGLGEDDFYLLDEAPHDWLELNRQWDRRFRELRASLFRRIGEPAMARDLVLREDEFLARSQAGWRALLAMPEEDDDPTD
jgi:hypothetical protein